MKIAIIGYGKMGKMIEQIAIGRGHDIVSIIDTDNQQDFDSEAFASADVAIEFTNPTAAYGNYLKAFAKGVKVVSGSTGWMKDHGDDVRRMCAEEGKTLFWASNFSVGVAIFSAVNRYLAKIMNGFPQYSVSMEETHHVHKLDAPSGTAITLAEEIIDNLDRKDKWVKGTLTAPDGTLTGIESAPATDADELRVYGAAGRLVIRTSRPLGVTVCNMQGQLLWHGTVDGERTLELESGVYVVNGKKGMVR